MDTYNVGYDMGNGKSSKTLLSIRSQMQKHILHDLNYMPCPEKAHLLKQKLV